MTVPIAVIMGIYMRYIRPGAVAEASIAGFIALMEWLDGHPFLVTMVLAVMFAVGAYHL